MEKGTSMRGVIKRRFGRRNGRTLRRSQSLAPIAAFVLLTGAPVAPLADVVSAASPDGGASPAMTRGDSSRSTSAGFRASPAMTSGQRAAVRRLQVAALRLRRTVDKVVRVPNDADFLAVTQAQFDRAELILAIRNARAVGLSEFARRYQRVLDVETKRLNEATAFSGLLRRAGAYGQQVAQKAHEENPNLPATVLGNIAVNAANWYGNDTLLKITLRAAKQKKPGLYEIAVKKDVDLDRRAYALYRSLSVGSRRTPRPYRGKEGLHELPDASGGFNGGFIGFRRAAETGSDSPAIDINVNGRVMKIHVRHQP
jgi:hypothetical protein